MKKDREEPFATELPHPKYFVFAHFTRFIRRGMVMLHCTEPWACAAFAWEENSLAAVLTNPSAALSRLRLRLPAFVPKTRQQERRRATAVLSEPQRRRLFVPCEVEEGRGGLIFMTFIAVFGRWSARLDDLSIRFIGDSRVVGRCLEVQEAAGCLELLVEVPAKSICSVLLPNVRLMDRGQSSDPAAEMRVDSPAEKLRKHSHDAEGGVSLQMVSSMARAAAEGAALERWLGQADLQTVRCWSYWEHEVGLAATALGAVPPAVPPQDTGFGDLCRS